MLQTDDKTADGCGVDISTTGEVRANMWLLRTKRVLLKEGYRWSTRVHIAAAKS
jgi:hypothetical protein